MVRKMANSPNNTDKNTSSEVDQQNAALLPQLETFERMLKLPVVEAAWHQGQDVYGKVKGK